MYAEFFLSVCTGFDFTSVGSLLRAFAILSIKKVIIIKPLHEDFALADAVSKNHLSRQ